MDAVVIFSNWRTHKQKLMWFYSNQNKNIFNTGILQALETVEMADMERRVFTIVFSLLKWK